MKSPLQTLLLPAALLLLPCAGAQATAITGWLATDSDTITDAGTSAPNFAPGSGGGLGGGLYAPLSPVTLSSMAVGDTLKLTASFQVVGGATSAGVGDQGIRFGLFDSNNLSSFNGWSGYLITVRTNNAQTIFERTGSPNTVDFGSTTNAGLLIGPNTFSSPINDANYNVTLSLTRTAAGLSIGTTVSNDNGYSINLAGFEDASLQSNLGVFDRVGFVFTTGFAVDNAIFSSVDVSLIPVPEPAGVTLLLAALLPLGMRRRR